MSLIEVILVLIGQIFTAGAIYGAMRSDLKNLHTLVQDAKNMAKEAHTRLDNHLDRRSTER